MTNENDFVKVNGSFETDAVFSHDGCLTNGILEVKGNFTQMRNTTNVYATGDHKVVFSGDEKQTKSLSNANARFATIEIKNSSSDGVYVDSYFNADSIIDENGKLSFANGKKSGWKLEKNETVESFDLIYGTLDLNGHTLTVTGELTQSGGIIKVNGGELKVEGSYKIATNDNGNSSGILDMTDKNDRVTVIGDFETHSTADHSNYLTAGVMSVGGNFTQYGDNYNNFRACGSHKMILNGTAKQDISIGIYDNNNSHFNELEITNSSAEGVEFKTNTFVEKKLYDTDSVVAGSARIILGSDAELEEGKWSKDLCINSKRTLSEDWNIGGSLCITGETFDVKGRKLTVGNNIVISGGVLYVDEGTVETGKDLCLRDYRVSGDGTVVFSGSSYGYLKMTKENDFVKVGTSA